MEKNSGHFFFFFFSKPTRDSKYLQYLHRHTLPFANFSLDVVVVIFLIIVQNHLFSYVITVVYFSLQESAEKFLAQQHAFYLF